jgi:hypothetical protein
MALSAASQLIALTGCDQAGDGQRLTFAKAQKNIGWTQGAADVFDLTMRDH